MVVDFIVVISLAIAIVVLVVVVILRRSSLFVVVGRYLGRNMVFPVFVSIEAWVGFVVMCIPPRSS